MKYLNYYNSSILEAQDKVQDKAQGQSQDKAQGQSQDKAQGQSQDKAQGQSQDKAQGQSQGQAQSKENDKNAERKAELDESNKKLEEKYPELKTITEDSLEFGKKGLGTEEFKKLEKFMDEITETEGFKEAMGVLRNLVKELGILKSLKLIKTVISVMKKIIQNMKKVRNVLSEGEKYNLCFSETHCELVIGGDDNDDNAIEEAIDKIKNALTVKNLMNILTGKTDELELQYMTKDGGEAEGEIKNVEIKDDGSIEVSIENDKVGTIKKDLTEITAAGDDVGGSDNDDDLSKKLADIKSKKPENIKKISTFVEFISKEENKDNKDKIYKIMEV